MRGAAPLVLLAAIAFAAPSRGQTRDSSFAPLRPDGNGIEALRTPITVGFVRMSAGEALTGIAKLARLNLTFDPRLRGVETRMYIPPRERSAAAALIEVAEAGRLRVRVSRDGQLIVDALPPVDGRPRVADTARSGPTSLPAIRSVADRREREEFNVSTNLGGTSMAGAELRSSPSFVEPDLLRSIQLLPGIQARSDYSAGFNSRGGESDQNLILIDGYPIYSPFHLGGVFSTFISPTVGRVNLHTGGLPVRYGGRLSSVLDVESAEPARRQLDGTVEVSLASTTASVGRAFGDDGSWMLAARRTYADAVVNLFKRNGFPYHFRDVQGHLAYTIGRGVRLGVTVYDGHDESSFSDDMFDGSWGNSVTGATLSKTFTGRFGDSLVIEQRASMTRLDVQLAFLLGTVNGEYPDSTRPLESVFDVNNHVRDVRIGGSVRSFAGGATRTLGYELATQRLGYRTSAVTQNVGDIFPLDTLDQRSRSASVYAQQTWRPREKLLVEGGARVDVLGARGSAVLSPRVSAKYFWRPDIAFSVGGGSYAQWLHSLGHEEQPIQPIQIWVASDSSLPVSRAHDAVVGFERWMTPRRILHVGGFYKRYDNVLLPNSASAPDVAGDEFFASRGASYGVDVLLRQLDGGPNSGWLAYSFAVSSRNDASGTPYAPTQDRRHNLNLVGSRRTGRWTLGAHLNVASGTPYTPVLGQFVREQYNPDTRRWTADPRAPGEQNIPGVHNGSRLPVYKRLDVSATYGGRLGGASFSPYLSVINLLNSKSPAAYVYDFSGPPVRFSFPNLPFAPTLGVTIVY